MTRRICRICLHREADHGHTYSLTPGRTYCLPCYWRGHPVFEFDIHDFRALDGEGE